MSTLQSYLTKGADTSWSEECGLPHSDKYDIYHHVIHMYNIRPGKDGGHSGPCRKGFLSRTMSKLILKDD